MSSIFALKIISPERTGIRQLFRLLVKYRRLLSLLIWRDLTVRYKQASVGILWVVLQPIITALIFTVIFGRLINMPTDGVPYLVFAFTGTAIWRLFAVGVDRCTQCILRDEQMITKVYFPRWIIPLAEVGGTCLDFFVTLAVLLLFVLFFQLHPGWHVLLLGPALLLVIAITASLGVSVALLCCKFRDLVFLISYGLQVMQFVSPVFYSLNLFGPKWMLLSYLNPMAGPIELFRLSITGRSHFSLTGFWISLAVDVLVFLAGLRVIYELEDELVDVI